MSEKLIEQYEELMDKFDDLKEERIRSQESEKSLKTQMKTKMSQVKEVTGAGTLKTLNTFLRDTKQEIVKNMEEAEEILVPYEEATSDDFSEDDDDF